MGDLFGSKAANRGFVIYEDEAKGIYSDALELWCRKLNELTANDFKTGIEGLEMRAEESYRDGEELWPPSYAEFKALCFPAVSKHDTLAHKPFDRSLAIEDKIEKEKRLELGRKEAARLLAMFEESEPKPLSQAELDDLARLERLK